MMMGVNLENTAQMEAAREISDAIVLKLATYDALDASTAIAAASRMAGTLLLISSGLPFRKFRPGTNIQSDSIDRQGQELMGAVSDALARLPLHMDSSRPDYYIPDASMPRMELRATQEILEPEMQTILDKHQLTGEQGAFAAAIASALLIHDCAGILDPRVGHAIATIGIAEASKTIPVVQ
jgi:hypothetical protein